jgi:MFS family permease
MSVNRDGLDGTEPRQPIILAHSVTARLSSRWWSFPRPVWILGLASLLTDVATEAVYPFFPLFLLSLGATELVIGLIEGTAEAVASVSKLASGRVSDRWRRRQPLVLGGYALSSIVRPALGLISAPWQGGAIRVIDRVGKGTRGAPRDALLAHFAPAGQRGRVFGFHRALDHMGAAIGPLVAAAFLWVRPADYRTLFLLTVIPGLVVMALLLSLRDPDAARMPPAARREPADSPTTPRLPATFWRLMVVLIVFTLGNSSDAFLILALGAAGFSGTEVALLWAAHHVVKSASSLLGGDASDRLGRRTLIIVGWLIYAGVYAGFAIASSAPALIALFLVYGLYHGLTEGAEKALVADWVPSGIRGTAFGVYGAALGLGAFAASVVFGALWMAFGPAAAFLTGATLALAATAGLLGLRPPATG